MQHFLPYSWVCHFSEKELNQRFNHDFYNLKPKHRVWSQHPTVSDSLPIKLLSGTVVTRGGIKRFTKKGVIFEKEEVGIIIPLNLKHVCRNCCEYDIDASEYDVWASILCHSKDILMNSHITV